MQRWLIVLFSLISTISFTQDHELYIAKYKQVAVVEMHRTGIPASIKLAQGILESNAGASMLATRANNHFGIKCGSEWKGKTMMRQDDDRNAHGKLIKSCFRMFESANESFVAHSEFLRDENKSYRYGFLFELPTNDYKAWARGLKKAGYATNPKYPELLIRIIEQYKLYEIDDEGLDMMAKDVEPTTLDELEHRKVKRDRVISVGDGRAYPMQYHNGIKTVIAYGGDSPASIAEQVDVKARKIVKYNESIGSEYETFEQGQIVYLQPKKSSYKGDQQYHVVKEGESMLHIADRYGIKVEKLYRKNGIYPGLQPAPGQRIAIKRRNTREVKVLSHAHTSSSGSNGNSQYLEELAPRQQNGSEVDRDMRDRVKALATYTVQSSDTLYAIARMHGVSVSALKKINNLRDDTIHPGQILKLDE